MLTSSIAIPNYKTNIGKTGLDILAKVEGFQEMAKNIQYKDDVMSSLESVDLYEVDYAFVTSKILPLAKNSEICYIFPDNMGRSKILYKAYINLESKKNPKKFYNFIEEDLADKTILKPNPEKTSSTIASRGNVKFRLSKILDSSPKCSTCSFRISPLSSAQTDFSLIKERSSSLF